MVEVYAHRGASAYAPENTLASFREALARGTDWLEMDVQLSRDGVPIVLHDDTLDRTTDGRGKPGDFTLEELRRLDAGAWFSADRRFGGERIPTLREVLAMAREAGVRVFPETKSPEFSPGVERALLDALRAEGMLERSAIQSFSAESLDRLRSAAPSVPLAALFTGREPSIEPPPANAEIVAPPYQLLLARPSLVDAAHKAGRKVVPYAVDDPETIRRLADMGIDGLITNTPDVARQVLNGRNQ